MGIRLHFLTRTTSSDVVADEGTHTRPPIRALNQLLSFVMAGVAGGDVIMMDGKNPAVEGLGDIGVVFVEKDAAVVTQVPIREGRAHRRGAESIKGINSCGNSRFRGIRRCNCKFFSKFSINEVGKEGIREQHDMLIISIDWSMVNATEEGIWSSEVAAGDMMEEEVIFGQHQLPSSLSSGQLLRGSKVQKVLMISKDNHRVGIPFEKVSPCFKSADDCEEFAIIDLVIPLCWVQGLREVTARVVRPVTVGLEEYSPCGEQGGVSG